MKKLVQAFLKKQNGYVLFLAIPVLMAVSVLGYSMVSDAYLNRAVGQTVKTKMRAFHAADGALTLLTKEVFGRKNDTLNALKVEYVWDPTTIPFTKFKIEAGDSSFKAGSKVSYAIDADSNLVWKKVPPLLDGLPRLRTDKRDAGYTLSPANYRVRVWNGKEVYAIGTVAPVDYASWTLVSGLTIKASDTNLVFLVYKKTLPGGITPDTINLKAENTTAGRGITYVFLAKPKSIFIDPDSVSYTLVPLGGNYYRADVTAKLAGQSSYSEKMTEYMAPRDSGKIGDTINTVDYSIFVKGNVIINHQQRLQISGKIFCTDTIIFSDPNFTVAIPPPPRDTLRINAGGSSYTDGSGKVWSAGYGCPSGVDTATTLTIANTSNQQLYQNARQDAATLTYQFNGIHNERYRVNLKFAELRYSSSGKRIFHIILNGNTFEWNFDIFAATGAKNSAITKSYTIDVTSGQIIISLAPVTGKALINAIEIIPDGQSDVQVFSYFGYNDSLVSHTFKPCYFTARALQWRDQRCDTSDHGGECYEYSCATIAAIPPLGTHWCVYGIDYYAQRFESWRQIDHQYYINWIDNMGTWHAGEEHGTSTIERFIDSQSVRFPLDSFPGAITIIQPGDKAVNGIPIEVDSVEDLINKYDLFTKASNFGCVITNSVNNCHIPLNTSKFLYDLNILDSVLLTEINFADTASWTKPTNFNGIVYIDYTRNPIKDQEVDGVRIINAENLSPFQKTGLTIVTPKQLYVQGTLNHPDSTKSAPYLKDTVPDLTKRVIDLGLVCDGITVLSKTWVDSTSQSLEDVALQNYSIVSRWSTGGDSICTFKESFLCPQLIDQSTAESRKHAQFVRFTPMAGWDPNADGVITAAESTAYMNAKILVKPLRNEPCNTWMNASIISGALKPKYRFGYHSSSATATLMVNADTLSMASNSIRFLQLWCGVYGTQSDSITCGSSVFKYNENTGAKNFTFSGACLNLWYTKRPGYDFAYQILCDPFKTDMCGDNHGCMGFRRYPPLDANDIYPSLVSRAKEMNGRNPVGLVHVAQSRDPMYFNTPFAYHPPGLFYLGNPGNLANKGNWRRYYGDLN